jgi:hypothetical protein
MRHPQFADKCDKWRRCDLLAVDLFIRCVVYYCSSKKLNKLIFFELKLDVTQSVKRCLW